MSTSAEHSIEDVLTTEELEKLGKPDVLEEIPDAQVARFGDTSAVTTPGSSIASSMDRFKAGNMTPAQRRTVEGLYSDFADGGERVIFASDEVRDLLGEEAVVKMAGFPQAYAVRVADPQEVADKVDEYDDQYAGNPSEYFWDEIDNNRAVMPAIYDGNGVKDSAPVTLMSGDGVLRSEDGMTAGQFVQNILHAKQGELSEDDLEDTEVADPTEIATQRYRAPDSSEAEYELDVMMPSGYEEANFDVGPQSLVIEVDGEKEIVNFPDHPEVLDYEENNGVYTFRIS
ncbi:hypothetical protein [Candidatus Nanohalovita haloferacivicina]|uniref:hypothetical protein n=1 Tax=Candidatus Nanohalovita haloferacivicina TaxID=2978046 RepID=UPI00325FA42F|nr:hypothetical protein HBNXNv_0488 [Candidatus Nanohalobia archaeon BNXNv]